MFGLYIKPYPIGIKGIKNELKHSNKTSHTALFHYNNTQFDSHVAHTIFGKTKNHRKKQLENQTNSMVFTILLIWIQIVINRVFGII